jgi:hypothetical protein
MTPSTFEFQVMSMHNQYICNDQTSSYKHLGLTIDELKVGQKFWDKFEHIIAVKSGILRIHYNTRSIVQLKLMFSCNAFKNHK